MIQVLGLGPHRLTAASRPAWFFEREKYGGILCDIGSHQIEQFLYYAGAQRRHRHAFGRRQLRSPRPPGTGGFRRGVSRRGQRRDRIISASIGSPRTDCAPGATAARSFSARRGTSNCANTSMSPRRAAGDHLLLVNGQGERTPRRERKSGLSLFWATHSGLLAPDGKRHDARTRLQGRRAMPASSGPGAGAHDVAQRALTALPFTDNLLP